MVSRRDFGKLALAAWPVSRALAAKINSDINGVRIGVQTYSFRTFPPDGIIDAVIHAMTEIGLGECELFGPQVEPNMMAALRGGGPPGGPRPQQPDPARAAARAKARDVPRTNTIKSSTSRALASAAAARMARRSMSSV